MGRKLMTDDENERQKQHLRSLLHNGILCEEFLPDIEKIEIHHYREHNSFAGSSQKEGVWTVTPRSEYYFVLDCLNRECTSIGFDLKGTIISAVRSHQDEVKGEMRCEGQEAPDHPEQSCDGKLKYTINVFYKRNT